MSLLIKICGITRVEDALAAVDAGADWLGLNFWPGTKRCVKPATARAIVEALEGRAECVGVFVNASTEDIQRILMDVPLDRIQLHGQEEPRMLSQFSIPAFKAFAVESSADLDRIPSYVADNDSYFLLDARHPTLPGGTGQRVNTELANAAHGHGRLLLAGGLRPENVADAITAVRPFGVDTASGVEHAPGVKDPAAMRAFIQAARSVAETPS